MEQIQTLLEKFNAGAASLQEQQELLKLLASNELDIKHLLTSSYYQNIEIHKPALSQEKSEAIFQLIQAHKNGAIITEDISNTKVIKSTFKWVQLVAAASIIAIAIIGTWYLGKPSSEQAVATNITTPKPTLQQITNGSNSEKSYTLLDGTTVTLSPKSAISYYQPFVKSRDISLTGEATFKVVKDAAKPFTVYTNHIATTALGTIFKVSSFQQSVKVVLIEGRIVVRPTDNTFTMKDTYLQPGQQLTINKVNGIYAVSNFRNNKETSNTESPSIATDKPTTKLAFNKTPLTEVITSIGNCYNVLIQYDKQDVQNLSFTGTFVTTDTLLTILTIICNTNDLAYKLDKGIIIISKQ
jgi:ferric-dicitrate binding protein FerR (iron transport regulator)